MPPTVQFFDPAMCWSTGVCSGRYPTRADLVELSGVRSHVDAR